MHADISFYDLLHSNVYNPSPYVIIEDRNYYNKNYDYDYTIIGSPQRGYTFQFRVHNMKRSRNELERYPNYRY